MTALEMFYNYPIIYDTIINIKKEWEYGRVVYREGSRITLSFGWISKK